MIIQQYISKPKVVKAIRFMGEDEGMPDFLSVKGTKLPPVEREGEFHNKIHDSYLRVKYGEWIIFTDDGDRWPCTNKIFNETYVTYTPSSKYSPHDIQVNSPVVNGANIPLLGFR
jgi:hypothetical protein